MPGQDTRVATIKEGRVAHKPSGLVRLRSWGLESARSLDCVQWSLRRGPSGPGCRPLPQPGLPPRPPSLQIQRNAYSIFFDEKFSIPLDPTALEEKSLRFSVFGIDEDERNASTGVVELKLSVLDLPLQPFSGWLYLQDQNKVTLTCLVLPAPSSRQTHTYPSSEGFYRLFFTP